jgi:hypothetical protein
LARLASAQNIWHYSGAFLSRPLSAAPVAVPVKPLPLLDFRGMCRDGLRAVEAAMSDGLVSARCPTTGAELRCGEFGIWYVADRRQLIGVDLGAPAGDRSVSFTIDPPVSREPIRAPGAPRVIPSAG